MKTRLNLTIEEALLNRMKDYAAGEDTSISEMVESYFKSVLRPPKQKSVVDLIEKIKKPDLDDDLDLKKEFYLQQTKKHGF